MRPPQFSARRVPEEQRRLHQQQHGQGDVRDQATRQDRRIVAAEGKRVGDVRQHRRPAGPPGPAPPPAERDRHDAQEQDAEHQLVHGVADFQPRHIVRDPRRRLLCARPWRAGDLLERGGVVRRNAGTRVRQQVGQRRENVEGAEHQQQHPGAAEQPGCPRGDLIAPRCRPVVMRRSHCASCPWRLAPAGDGAGARSSDYATAGVPRQSADRMAAGATTEMSPAPYTRGRVHSSLSQEAQPCRSRPNWRSRPPKWMS